jgi:hypothetical protein
VISSQSGSSRYGKEFNKSQVKTNIGMVLRPFSVFDMDGIITYDHGGEQFVKNSHHERYQ